MLYTDCIHNRSALISVTGNAYCDLLYSWAL